MSQFHSFGKLQKSIKSLFPDNITSIILIGAMKSGTSSLYNHLIKHPAIAPCVTKEPEYFSEDLGTWEVDGLKMKDQAYFDLFEIDTNQHKFTLDASTGYTKYPRESGVPKRIFEYGLNPYFIYIVRDPIERTQSQYNFMVQKGFSAKDMLDPQIINVSKYHMQLEQYLKYFPKKQFLILDFDDLKIHPVSVCQQIFEFVKATPYQIKQESTVLNKTKGEKNKTRKKIYNAFKPIEKIIPKTVKSQIEGLFDRFFPYTQKQMTESQKKQIHALLKEDMKQFQKNWHFDVSKWGF